MIFFKILQTCLFNFSLFSDSKLFKTFIGSKALLKWYIDKPSYPVNVQVKNGRGEVLFDVYGTEAKVRGTYEDRITFTGDVDDGRIEFMLDNCSYADEGVYVASYGETEFKGPKLVLCKIYVILFSSPV